MTPTNTEVHDYSGSYIPLKCSFSIDKRYIIES